MPFCFQPPDLLEQEITSGRWEPTANVDGAQVPGIPQAAGG
jgi:hypothetical protein